MPHDGLIPIGHQADKDRAATQGHLAAPDTLCDIDTSAPLIDAGVRALAERRLELICTMLDLPPAFFEHRALADAYLKGIAGAEKDPDIAKFLDGQDGAPMVDIVDRIEALKDQDLQRRLLRYLSCIDV